VQHHALNVKPNAQLPSVTDVEKIISRKSNFKPVFNVFTYKNNRFVNSTIRVFQITETIFFENTFYA